MGQKSFLSPNQHYQSNEEIQSTHSDQWPGLILFSSPTRSWWKGHCSLYADSPTIVPVQGKTAYQ